MKEIIEKLIIEKLNQLESGEIENNYAAKQMALELVKILNF